MFDGEFQGTRSYLKGLYTELIKDQDKHFFLAAKDVENLQQEFGDQENVTCIKYKSHSAVKRLLVEIPKLIWRNKIDFAHFQYRVPPIKRCKYIVTTHDVLFIDFPEYFPKAGRIEGQFTYKFSARISEIVLTVSGYSRDKIAAHFGVKAAITPNGVDEVFYQDYNKETVQKQVKTDFGFDQYVLYVSRREPRKNQHLVLKYFAELELYKTMHLVLVGCETFKNPEFDAVWNRLDERVRQKVLIIADLPFDKMLMLLRGSRATVYPSMAEGFGIPPLEAAAAKIPTICSNRTAMSDFDFFGNDFFDPTNEAEFKEKFLRVATTTPDEVELKRRQDIVRENYNWQKAAHVYRGVLEKYL